MKTDPNFLAKQKAGIYEPQVEFEPANARS
jgi:hypothetical protein